MFKKIFFFEKLYFFKTYKNFIAAKEELSQDLFNKEIDLVYFNSINLNPIIKDEIERKRIRIG